MHVYLLFRKTNQLLWNMYVCYIYLEKYQQKEAKMSNLNL